ncbi:VOC family protein, partial [Burkholderia multivorans]
LGTDDAKPIPEIHIDWSAPHGAPGIMSVTFATERNGLVTI